MRPHDKPKGWLQNLSEQERTYRIKIIKNGPYLVYGGVPLFEERILPKGNGYVYEHGRELPQAQTYALCRCGKTSTPPFCDGAHAAAHFDGTETACRDAYLQRATLLPGAGVDLLDDGRCAFARFCHREEGDAWELAEASDTPHIREEAVRAASECPAGRLTSVTKDGALIELPLEPGIVVLQDPEESVSAGLYVRGGIPIESAGGSLYEVRNRVVLCRCGASKNKPFCDMQHVVEVYDDGKI